MFSHALQIIQIMIDTFRRSVFIIQFLQFLPDLFPPFFDRGQLLFVVAHQFFKIVQKFRPFRMVQYLFFLWKMIIDQRFQPFVVRLPLLLQQAPCAVHQFLIPCKYTVVEQPAQYLIFFIAVRFQEFPEFSLRQHYDLPELVHIHPQQFSTTPADFLRAFYRNVFRFK